MKISTVNVNGVNGRLAVLIKWLEMARPDIACLQELKAPREKFHRPRSRRRATERSGMGKKAGMASLFSRAMRSP
jgi:exodeoxyribonuclease III